MKAPLDDERVEIIINNVKTTMAVEGLEVTNFAEELGRKYLKGEITSDEAIKIIKEYYLKERR